MLLTIFVVVLSVYSAQAGFSTGKCLDTPNIAKIDFNRYVGEWYEIERFNSWFERNLKCGKAKYSIIDSNTISVENSGIDKKTGVLSSVVGKASVINQDVQNKLTLLLPIIVAGIQVYENEGKYNIWDTDYDNYALIYSCKEIIPGLVKSETSWVLSRQRTLPAATTQYLKDVLATEGLNLDFFEVVDQDGC